MRLSPLLLGLLGGCATSHQPVPPEAVEPLDLRASWQGHVDTLASDAYLGRGTGEEGGRLASTYAAEHFASLGLVPVDGDDDFFAPVTFWATDWDAATTATVTGAEVSLELGKSFAPFDFSDEGKVDAEVVFAGYGITSEEDGWDDYEGLDVEGKIVVLLRHEPREDDASWDKFQGAETTDHSAFMTKAQVASERGAVGMILATDPLHHEAGDDFRGRRRLLLDKPEDVSRGPSQGPQFLAIHASQESVGALLAGTGKTLSELQAAVDEGTKPRDLAVEGVRATLSLTAATEAIAVEDRNVVAMLPGKDPEKRDEIVVIGAHYDHLGAYEGAGDTVFNGADDNASGTAGVLELARHFAAEPTDRSLVFALFTGEEKGLLGSKAFVKDRTVDLDQVVFMLNLDMISRNAPEAVEVLGEAYSEGLAPIVQSASDAVGLDIVFGGTNYVGNSDHDSFYREHIPFMFFFTGLHDDYHQLSDHADTVDSERAAKVVEASIDVVRALGDQPENLAFVHHLSWMGASVRATSEGALIASVDPDGRAHAAGLTAGDLVHTVAGESLVAADVGAALADVEPGTTLSLEITRDGAIQGFELERAKTGYLGIYPGGVEDEVKAEFGLLEGEGLAVMQVVEDGPAGQGGLQSGDIIYRINGMPTDRRSLGTRLARIGAGETISVDIVRAGERQTLTVTLGERPER